MSGIRSEHYSDKAGAVLAAPTKVTIPAGPPHVLDSIASRTGIQLLPFTSRVKKIIISTISLDITMNVGVHTYYMDTQSIQLRTVPVDIARILKSRAALTGVSLEKYVTDLITKAALRKDGKK